MLYRTPALSTVRRRAPPQLVAASRSRTSRPRRGAIGSVGSVGSVVAANAAVAATNAIAATTSTTTPTTTPLSQAAASAAADAAFFFEQERGQLRELAGQATQALLDGSAAAAVSGAASGAVAPFAVFGGQAVALNVLFCGSLALISYALLFKAPRQ